ncbi:hypothetical protein ROU88_09045 [Macrococcus capreoli]|uniref:hypothetical protein n=1 Tax=Macrococcus capreoli TaxID=2982690 RepID=UPI0021D5A9CC|nr:hypothetical protein [Macrococcus sp. TMW 2.2395]MCU7557852.1 hypothetical protein [Macrococcus sp. TMW 2.2395]
MSPLQSISNEWLQRFDHSQTDEEMMALIQLMSNERPVIHDIVIGCSRNNQALQQAYQFKVLWETYGGFDGSGGTVLAIVSWNPNSSSFNKYVNRIAQHLPDAFVALGETHGFEQIMRRLHRFTEIKANRTFVLSTLESQHMINSGGMFIFEGLKGTSKIGTYFSVQDGIIQII